MFALLVLLLGLVPTAPTISTLTPNNALVNAATVQFSVIGSSFPSSATIQWNGTSVQTQFINAGLLVATVPANLRATAGTYTVTVSGGGTSNALPFTINNPLPAIDSISPRSVLVNTSQVQVRVFGRNFVGGAAIYKNDQVRGTHFVSSREVSFPLFAAELTSIASWQISVSNPTPGGGKSASLPFSVLASSTTTSTSSLSIARFHIGGSTNPERVFANKAVPLYALRSTGSVAPTHWRVSTGATMSGAAWQPVSTAATYTFPPSSAGDRTLFFQYRYIGGGDTVTAVPVSDVVTVRRPWVEPAPVVYGKMTSDRRILRCPFGPTAEVLTGVRIVQNDYLVVTAVGYNCAGHNLSLVGGDLKGDLSSRVCTNQVVKRIGLRIGPPVPPYLVGAGGMVMRQSEGKVVDFNGWCETHTLVSGGTFDPLYAVAVPGTMTPGENYSASISCPAGAFPIGLDIYFEKTAVVGAGMRCAQPD